MSRTTLLKDLCDEPVIMKFLESHNSKNSGNMQYLRKLLDEIIWEKYQVRTEEAIKESSLKELKAFSTISFAPGYNISSNDITAFVKILVKGGFLSHVQAKEKVKDILKPSNNHSVDTIKNSICLHMKSLINIGRRVSKTRDHIKLNFVHTRQKLLGAISYEFEDIRKEGNEFNVHMIFKHRNGCQFKPQIAILLQEQLKLAFNELKNVYKVKVERKYCSTSQAHIVSLSFNIDLLPAFKPTPFKIAETPVKELKPIPSGIAPILASLNVEITSITSEINALKIDKIKIDDKIKLLSQSLQSLNTAYKQLEGLENYGN